MKHLQTLYTSRIADATLIIMLSVVVVFLSCGRQTKIEIKADQDIIMYDDTLGFYSDRFDDSIYSVSVAKSEKTLLCSNIYDGNVVADSLSAVLIAKAVWYPIYGKDVIDGEQPFVVYQNSKYWLVMGTLPKGYLGGVAEVIIRKSDGKIMQVCHGK